MYKNGGYTGDDRMCDLVSDRFAVLQVMSRFGIALGFGDKTIAEVCEEHAIKMVEHDASDLVVPDPEAQKKAADAAKTRAEIAKTKEEGKKVLTKVLDSVEKMAD